ncbi:unnamed protein product, partial [Staurois parvus]
MGPLDNRGLWGPCVLAHTQTTSKKVYKRYQGYLMGPPLTLGPEWSVCPCLGPWGYETEFSNSFDNLDSDNVLIPISFHSLIRQSISSNQFVSFFSQFLIMSLETGGSFFKSFPC